MIDSTNKPKDLVKYAMEIGLQGIAITDHECLSGHIELNMFQQEIKEKNPDFKIMLGNEIYLVGAREKKQKYYHFILIAKNQDGYRALKELSSNSWLNSYWDGPLERVPTLYSEIEDIMKKYPNSLVATTACLGGELSTLTAKLIDAENTGDTATAKESHQGIINFILWAKEVFGEDFYIECAPGASLDQVKVNKRLVSIAQAFNVKMVIGSDAHYLTKADRYVHKSFLNSKHGEREVDDFYEYCYLQNDEEVVENLQASDFNEDFINQMFDNSMEIYNKVEEYSLLHKSVIPQVHIKDEAATAIDFKNYPNLESLYKSNDGAEKYWVNNCLNELNKKYENNELHFPIEEYYSRLEEEADIQKVISEKLETNMFNYPITLQHYINLFWECGSIVGAGRGSACAGLNHYLMGITQLDPLQWSLPYWR